ncbi:VCBS repeat-containing protein [Sorangium sp. So ce185]|uniref:FG-GAP repeat domain-containing protein n=1 Tax=Sorangium sp. So ce185 TaxID=3133287 RepID=UPI003F5F5A0D
MQTHPRVRDLNGEVIYTPSTPANSVEDTLLLDADDDGALDIVVAQQEGLVFLHNQGGGAFEPPRTIAGPTTFSSSAVDHDGDGVLDLVGLGYDSKILVYRGDGDGGYELTHDLPAGVFMSGIVTGDVTGDGRPDAVIGMDGVGAGVAVFPHDAERGFDTSGQQVFFETTPPSSGVSFVSVAVGDVNNDGRQDVAAVTHEHSDGPMRVWILLQDDLGKLTAPQPLLTIDDPQVFASGGLQIADLNLDGRSDLVVVSPNTAEMWSFLQTAEGTFEGQPAPFPGTSRDIDGFGIGITDFDCNGCPDVVGVQVDGLVVFRGRGCATAP